MNWDLFILWLFSKLWGDDWIDLEFFDLRIFLALSLLWTTDPYNQLPLQDFYLRVQQGPWAFHTPYEVMMSTTTPNNRPAVSPFQLKATLFFQLLRPNLRVTLDISYSLCPIADPSANPVGCFLQNIFVFPASFDRVNGSPWLELDHPLHLQGHDFTMHIYVEKIRTYLFWPWYLLSPGTTSISGLPGESSVLKHSSSCDLRIGLSDTFWQPLPTLTHHVFWNVSSEVS